MADVVVKVENVHKSFKLPHQKHNSIKGLFLNAFKGSDRYENQKVLKNIDFEVNRGDFIAIVGRNGSGKSTLLKLLAGIYTPDRGLIHVNGKLIPFIELGVGFNPELTGRENVFLNGALLGFNRKEMLAMYDDIVSFSEIEKFMDQKLKNYSSGMQVRLAFSIAIRARGDILLLDEVLAVGDAAFQQKCFDYFEQLKREKKTVIFVSHDMTAVRRFCNKAIYVSKGVLTHAGTPAEVSDIYSVDNIENTIDGSRITTEGVGNYKLSPKIKHESDKEVIIEFTFKSQTDEDLYIALSILKDGNSVAEMNSLGYLKLKQKGVAEFKIDKTRFNAGVYELTCIICRQKDKHLMSIGTKNLTFTVSSEDDTRGAALWLDNTWHKLK